MKILLLTAEFAPFRGGIGTYACEMANAATELGHSVTVLAPDYGQDLRAHDTQYPFNVIRYAGSKSSAFGLPSRILAVFMASLKWREFDCVNATCWPFYIPLALSNFRGRVRCLLTFHGTEINLMAAKRRRSVLNLIKFWSPWTEYVANSTFTARLLQNTFESVPAGSVIIAPLAVSSSWKIGGTPRLLARELLKIEKSTLLLVTLGRLVKRKGHLKLLSAIDALPDPLKRRIVWKIVGTGTDEDYIQSINAAIKSSNLNVELTGALPNDELKLLLSAADLFCLTGYQDEAGEVEGFGLAYLEAAAFGVPSLGTSVGGVPDAVEDGVSGLLFASEDAEGLARGLEKILSDDDLRADLAIGARRRAEASSWQTVAELTYGRPH